MASGLWASHLWASHLTTFPRGREHAVQLDAGAHQVVVAAVLPNAQHAELCVPLPPSTTQLALENVVAASASSFASFACARRVVHSAPSFEACSCQLPVPQRVVTRVIVAVQAVAVDLYELCLSLSRRRALATNIITKSYIPLATRESGKCHLACGAGHQKKRRT